VLGISQCCTYLLVVARTVSEWSQAAWLEDASPTTLEKI
jgi:hypothetical protein